MPHLHVRAIDIEVMSFISHAADPVKLLTNDAVLPRLHGVVIQPSPRSPPGNTGYEDSARALARNSASKIFTLAMLSLTGQVE